MEASPDSKDTDPQNIILNRLTKLGDPYLARLEVNDHLIKQLSDIWTSFKHQLISGNEIDIPQTFRQLLRYTAYIIFDVSYMKEVGKKAKATLVDVVKSATPTFIQFPSFHKICLSLQEILRDPWSAATCNVVLMTSIKELSSKAIDDLYSSEGWLLLEIRLEVMGRSKKMPMRKLMAKIVHVCIVQGAKLYPTGAELENSECDKNFHPFNLSPQKYLQFLEIRVILGHKYKQEKIVNANDFMEICPGVMSKVIQQLLLKSTTKEPDRLVYKLWNIDLDFICSNLVQELVPNALHRVCWPPGVKGLLSHLIHFFLERTEPSERLTKLYEYLSRLMFKREEIALTDYIYFLAEIVLEKCGVNEKTREIYVFVYLRALLSDLNYIEVLRAQVPIKTEKLRTENLAFSSRLLTLAKFFEDFPSTARQIILTCFSLNPIKELFDQVFPKVTKTTKVEVVKNKKKTTKRRKNGKSVSPNPEPEQSDNDKQQQKLCTGKSKNKESKEVLQLPQTLIDDLDTIINKPRWSALGHFTKERELKMLCEKLLREGNEWLISDIKLNYVKEEDVEKYAHLPSQYEHLDDGYEYNFYLPNSREAKRRRLGLRFKKVTVNRTKKPLQRKRKGTKRSLRIKAAKVKAIKRKSKSVKVGKTSSSKYSSKSVKAAKAKARNPVGRLPVSKLKSKSTPVVIKRKADRPQNTTIAISTEIIVNVPKRRGRPPGPKKPVQVFIGPKGGPGRPPRAKQSDVVIESESSLPTEREQEPSVSIEAESIIETQNSLFPFKELASIFASHMNRFARNPFASRMLCDRTGRCVLRTTVTALNQDDISPVAGEEMESEGIQESSGGVETPCDDAWWDEVEKTLPLEQVQEFVMESDIESEGQGEQEEETEDWEDFTLASKEEEETNKKYDFFSVSSDDSDESLFEVATADKIKAAKIKKRPLRLERKRQLEEKRQKDKKSQQEVEKEVDVPVPGPSREVVVTPDIVPDDGNKVDLSFPKRSTKVTRTRKTAHNAPEDVQPMELSITVTRLSPETIAAATKKRQLSPEPKPEKKRSKRIQDKTTKLDFGKNSVEKIPVKPKTKPKPKPQQSHKKSEPIVPEVKGMSTRSSSLVQNRQSVRGTKSKPKPDQKAEAFQEKNQNARRGRKRVAQSEGDDSSKESTKKSKLIQKENLLPPRRK